MTKVLIAGDSLALGLTGPLKNEAQQYAIDLVGDGRMGTTAHQWVTGGWLAKDIADQSPNVTLISLGTNDAMGDLSGFASDVRTLIEQATSKGGVLAWIGPPYFSPAMKHFPTGHVEQMRQTLSDALGPAGIKIFPSDTGAAQNYPRSTDGIHMTPAGYAQWAHDIADFAAFPAAVKPGPIAVASGMSTRAKVGIAILGLGVVGGAIWWAREAD